MVAGDPAQLPGAGAFDHQQRQRTRGTRLQNQQAVELQRADQQGGCGQQFAEQLRDRLRIRVFGQHVLVAFAQANQLTANIGVVEQEALSVIGIVHWTTNWGKR
ncbi:hypothetical protein D9M68_834970 [compost metagenome]